MDTNLTDVDCTLDLVYIIDLGCGLLHPHHMLSFVVAEHLVVITIL